MVGKRSPPGLWCTLQPADRRIRRNTKVMGCKNVKVRKYGNDQRYDRVLGRLDIALEFPFTIFGDTKIPS